LGAAQVCKVFLQEWGKYALTLRENEAALRGLEDEVAGCQRCGLRAGCQRVVFGEGVPGKGLMVVGEGPGQEEDKSGRPFVGRAGRLLDLILESGGFSRTENTYVANIVKCRPPGNRVPLPEERAACMPYLLEQIRLVEPKIVILLGATALQGLIDPKGKIGACRGQWQTWRQIAVMPTYHPAALLRNPGLKLTVWEDLKLVIDRYRELVAPGHSSPYY
jgi:DNA polymerase